MSGKRIHNLHYHHPEGSTIFPSFPQCCLIVSMHNSGQFHKAFCSFVDDSWFSKEPGGVGGWVLCPGRVLVATLEGTERNCDSGIEEGEGRDKQMLQTDR